MAGSTRSANANNLGPPQIFFQEKTALTPNPAISKCVPLQESPFSGLILVGLAGFERKLEWAIMEFIVYFKTSLFTDFTSPFTRTWTGWDLFEAIR